MSIQSYTSLLRKAREEISRVVVGQDKVTEGLMAALLSNGHILLEGVPGVAKTLIIRSLSKVFGCSFGRIQFTADLLPSDLIGITAYSKEKGFYTIKGPIFANFILADEVNRAPPKVQAAMLEAMQERQATIGKQTYPIEPPFFVMATQNPIESLGTYPLPEAELDRFLFKLVIDYPNTSEEEIILDRNITIETFDSYNLKPVLSRDKVLEMQAAVKKIQLNPSIKKYIVRIIEATRSPKKYDIKLGKYIEWGASPRASISLYIGAKANTFLSNRLHATPQNVKNIAYHVLRHRILISYEGQAEGVKSDHIIDEILRKTPIS